jgi:hypothetical protein
MNGFNGRMEPQDADDDGKCGRHDAVQNGLSDISWTQCERHSRSSSDGDAPDAKARRIRSTPVASAVTAPIGGLQGGQGDVEQASYPPDEIAMRFHHRGI